MDSEAPETDSPRSFSPASFLTGFGFGSFVGVALAIAAIALVARPDENQSSVIAPTVEIASEDATLTPTPTRARTRVAVDVHLGPGDAFAVVGTLAGNEALEIVGRDNAAGWVAIRFPPGSSGRGWLAVSEVEGLSGVDELAVVLPTPLPRSISVPTPQLSGGFSSDAVAVLPNVSPTSSQTPTIDGAPPLATVTPSIRTGPTDLAVTRAFYQADGSVGVVIGNRGPGDLVGQTIFVQVRDLSLNTETIISQGRTLLVGGTLTLQSNNFRIDSETDVQVIVDPYATLTDNDRSNNTMTVTLSPPRPPTPTPGPGGIGEE